MLSSKDTYCVDTLKKHGPSSKQTQSLHFANAMLYQLSRTATVLFYSVNIQENMFLSILETTTGWILGDVRGIYLRWPRCKLTLWISCSWGWSKPLGQERNLLPGRKAQKTTDTKIYTIREVRQWGRFVLQMCKKYLLIPGGTTIGSCANTLLMPFSATIFALAMGSIMSSVTNLSRSERKQK